MPIEARHSASVYPLRESAPSCARAGKCLPRVRIMVHPRILPRVQVRYLSRRYSAERNRVAVNDFLLDAFAGIVGHAFRMVTGSRERACALARGTLVFIRFPKKHGVGRKGY